MSTGGHVRQRSPGAWEVRYRVDGKLHTTTVRCTTKKEAVKRLRELLTTADQGMHVAKVGLMVENLLCDRIETWHASGKITTRTAESYMVAANIAAPIGDVPLQQLSIGHIERWHLAMRQRGLSASSTRAAHGLVRRALADAVKHRLVARNVAADHGPPSVEPAERVTAPNRDQTAALLAKLAGDAWWVPVIVALYCGLRRGEQLALRWNRIDLDGAKMRVVEALEQSQGGGVSLKRPKTAAGTRSISLPAIVVEALREHRKRQLERALLLGLGRPPADALVFPDAGGGYQVPRAFTQRWMRLTARLGMRATWHSLRHAHASMLIRERVPVTEVADRLGHANPMVTLKVYAHLFDRDDRASADAIDRMLGR